MTVSATTHRWQNVLVLAFLVLAITGAGVFLGWVSDQSLLPFYGGGWRCYVGSVVCVWAMVLLPLLVAGIPFGAAVFARWLTNKISG
jgi:hypothetical protein